MKTIKVVFDTNILISGYLFGGNPSECLEIAREGKIKVFTSKSLLLELAEKLYSKFGWKEEDIKRLLENIAKYIEIVEPEHRLDVIKKDDSDNRVLEVSREVEANFIVTGDNKHILPLKKFGSTQIVTAAVFIKLIDIEN